MTEIRTPADADAFLQRIGEFHDGHIALIHHRRNGDVEVHFSNLPGGSLCLTFSGDASYCAAEDRQPWHTASIHFLNGFVYLVDNSVNPGFLPEDPGSRYCWFRARRLTITRTERSDAL